MQFPCYISASGCISVAWADSSDSQRVEKHLAPRHNSRPYGVWLRRPTVGGKAAGCFNSARVAAARGEQEPDCERSHFHPVLLGCAMMWVNGSAGRTTCSAFLAAVFGSFHSGTSADGAAQGVSSQRLGSASFRGEHPFPGDFRNPWASSVPFPSLPVHLRSDRCCLANGGSGVNSLSGNSPLVCGISQELFFEKPIFISNHQIMRLGQGRWFLLSRFFCHNKSP